MFGDFEITDEPVTPPERVAPPAANRQVPRQKQLDEESFPLFRELLVASQDYAELSGCRFRGDCFDLAQRDDACFAEELARRVVAPDAEKAAIMKARPVVQKYMELLRADDEGLHAELERARQFVFRETLRVSIKVTCQRLELWPPRPAPESVDENDFSYEDLSEPLDIIAQRAFNYDDKMEKGDDGLCFIHRRTMTASYLVDFASEIGLGNESSKMGDTFKGMLADLNLRTLEWEECLDKQRQSSPSGQDSGKLRERAAAVVSGWGGMARDRLRARFAQQPSSAVGPADIQATAAVQETSEKPTEMLADAWSDPPTRSSSSTSMPMDSSIGEAAAASGSGPDIVGYELMVDNLSISLEPCRSGTLQLFYEFVVEGTRTHQTSSRALGDTVGWKADFVGEGARFVFQAQFGDPLLGRELLVRVRERRGLLRGCPVLCEERVLLESQLKVDGGQLLHLPLTVAGSHACVLTLRLRLAACAAAAPAVNGHGASGYGSFSPPSASGSLVEQSAAASDRSTSASSFAPSTTFSSSESESFAVADGRSRLSAATAAAAASVASVAEDLSGAAADVKEAGGRLVGVIGEAVSSAPAVPGVRLLKRAGFGTCALEDAMFLVITEEGIGFCYYYAYERQEEAERYFNATTWLPVSRLMFCYNGKHSGDDAPVLEELRKAGPPMAHNTIRLAAQAFCSPQEAQPAAAEEEIDELS
eukprot:TRINITY_DN113805_c0_g1_i1.p1 TRINITY_DN113805_c0_g1~~TRINITY_DN113805_c0_g1_i1.p1  ORF type:complete len:706 (-),score=201.11 TRINITY_DN113805_c0_g1_i1:229-2346(-)